MGNPNRQEMLSKAAKLAARYESATDPELSKLVRSKQALERLAALLIMQSRARESETIGPYLDVARQLIHDADNTCRWQALILVGVGIEREPELVWEVISAEGGSHDEDMRAGVATILLEDLLDEHFETYFPLVRERVLSGDADFIGTTQYCWLSDPVQEKRLKSLVRNAQRGHA